MQIKDCYYQNGIVCLNIIIEGRPRGVEDKLLDSNEFELQSRYYVHFRMNILEKGMKPTHPILLAMHEIVSQLFFIRYYLLTPPLGQDKTQGQFLNGV